MARLIICTFAFLGWAFYEMSGGADFEPASARLTNVKENPLMPVVSTAGAEPVAARVGTQVTRVSLNLTSVEDVLSGNDRRTRVLPQQQSETAATEIAPARQGESVAIIPSLVNGADASNVVEVAAVATPAPATLSDFRSVTGNRVNVRGGPSTAFGVVGRLVRGDEVEVLEDTGDGWIRFRALDSETTGWVADFLLTSG